MCYCSCWPSTHPKRSTWWTTEMNHSVLGENWQDRASYRYFQEPILWAHFFYYPQSTKILHDDDCFSWLVENFTRLAETFWKNMCLIAYIPPLPKSQTYWPPCCLWGSLSELSEVLSPRMQSSYCPKLNLTHNSHKSSSISFNSPKLETVEMLNVHQ